MITTNYSNTNFKGHTLHESYKLLGIQGRKSYEITKPFIEDISKDCNLIIGATPNINRSNKPTLTVISETITTPAKGFFKKLKQFFTPKPYSASQSSTEAISPNSLGINLLMAKVSLPNQDPEALTKKLETFFSTPKMQEEVSNYGKSFSKIPTPEALGEDLYYGTEVAVENGHAERRPF